MCNVCDGENYVNVSAYRILTTFCEKLQFRIQLQKSVQCNVYFYCNVLHAGEFLIFVSGSTEDGGVLLKHVAVNRKLYFCVCQVCACCHK